ANGAPGGFLVHGAQLRAAEEPNNQKYWAKIENSLLEVHRRDTYTLARWSPLLEKAYARFSQDYGPYGGGQNGAQEKGTSSGYDNIGGGVATLVLEMFYGAEGDTLGANSGNAQEVATNWAPGAQVLATNPKVVDQLLLLEGRGEQGQDGDRDAPIVAAAA